MKMWKWEAFWVLKERVNFFKFSTLQCGTLRILLPLHSDFVWNQFLMEIKTSNLAFLTFLELYILDFGQFGPVKKTKIVPNQLSEPLNLSKMTVFDASTLASLVSHKIWVARKSLNFHTVPVKFRWFSKFHTSRDNFRIFTQKKSLVRIFLLFQILVVLVVVLKAKKNYVKSSFSRNQDLFSRNFSQIFRKNSPRFPNRRLQGRLRRPDANPLQRFHQFLVRPRQRNRSKNARNFYFNLWNDGIFALLFLSNHNFVSAIKTNKHHVVLSFCSFKSQVESKFEFFSVWLEIQCFSLWNFKEFVVLNDFLDFR